MTQTGGGPRIPPLGPPYDPSIKSMINKGMPAGSTVEPLALFRTLAVHGDLAARMRPLGAGILAHGRIEPREREIVIHRTCARAGAEYEWGVHALVYGKPLGLSDEQLVASARGGADDPAWSGRDPLLIRFADELHDTCTVSDEVWSARFRTDDRSLERCAVTT